jgi:aldose 1-epimerase
MKAPLRRACTLTMVLAALAAAPRIDMAELSKPDAISSRRFGRLPAGGAVTLYTLRNRHGMQTRIATYGGIVESSSYFGALIGRYANRIAGAQFTLNGTRYRLAANDGPNALHGGRIGFDKVVWTVTRARVTAQGPISTCAGRETFSRTSCRSTPRASHQWTPR